MANPLATLGIEWILAPQLIAWANGYRVRDIIKAVGKQTLHPVLADIPDFLSAAGYVPGIERPATEQVLAVYVDYQTRLLATQVVSSGLRRTCQIEPAVLLRGLAASNCDGVVLIHNHTTDSPVPTMDDVHLTRSLAFLLHCAGVVLMDHVIIGATGRYWSFASGWREYPTAAGAENAMPWVLTSSDKAGTADWGRPDDEAAQIRRLHLQHEHRP